MRIQPCTSLLVVAFLAALASPATAGLTPREVAVIVNANPSTPGVAALSNAVAQYYCSQRGIPAENIIQLTSQYLTPDETTQPFLYYRDIYDTLASALQSRFGSDPDHPETDPIKCLVLCPGIPIQMWGSEPVGCVDSALALMFNETPWGRAPVGAYLRWSGTRIGNPYFDSYYVSTQTANS